MNFVEDLHSYFNFPQRRAKFKAIQESLGKRELVLKKYIDSRWLSLGESLNRLLIILEEMGIYMDRAIIEEEGSLENLIFFSTCLKDEHFYMEILFLTSIISRLNDCNKLLQSQDYQAHEFKTEIRLCFKFFLRLVVREEKVLDDIKNHSNLDWTEPAIQNEWFMDNSTFIDSLSENVHEKLSCINNWSLSDKTTFAQEFKQYIAKILSLTCQYLDIKNEIIDIIDFVKLEDDEKIFKDKILKYNNELQIISSAEIPNLKKEIETKFENKFTIEYNKKTAQANALFLWDLIERSSKPETYKLLGSIIKSAHVIPVSSAGIEQSFSSFKYIKTDIRNRLSSETFEALILINQEKKWVSNN